MKPLALCLLAAAPLGVAAQPSSGSIPTPTRDWGCEVLLCLANPAGPTAVSECVPPIRKLWRHLSRGKPFPTCAMASGPRGSSYARLGHSHYDPCPPGTAALAPGQTAQLAAPMSPAAPPSPSTMPTFYAPAEAARTYVGIGTGDGLGTSRDDSPTKVCVGGYRGLSQVWTPDGDAAVAVYDAIYLAPAQASPRVIDVYIDNAFWHRVRW